MMLKVSERVLPILSDHLMDKHKCCCLRLRQLDRICPSQKQPIASQAEHASCLQNVIWPHCVRRCTSQVPALVDGDGPPILESGAILQYLQAKYGGGRLAVPPHDARFGAYLQWLWAGEATLMPSLDGYYKQWVSVPDDKRDEKVLFPLRKAAETAYGAAERAVTGKKYILGDEFTAADIMVGYSVMGFFEFKLLELADFPNLKAYLARLAARPACPAFDASIGGA